MNDLAEKALDGLAAARRWIVARPVGTLALLGFSVASGVVVTGGRIGAAPSAVPLSRWLGLLSPAGYETTGVGMGVAMLTAIGALLALWLVALRTSRLRRFTARQMYALAAGWAAPFAIGPPLLSTDVYRAVADGELARRGHSPYATPPYALGPMRLVDAIDPDWRNARSTDGPLAGLISHLAVSVTGGNAVAAVIVLRLIAIVAVIVLGRMISNFAGARRVAALGLTVLNPATLLFVVSACLYTGIVAVLLVAAFLAAAQRRWLRAVVLGCLAAGLKPVAVLAVPAIVLVHVFGRPGRSLRPAVRDCAVALATLAVLLFVVPYGRGWAANLGSAAHAHTPFAPASIVGNLLGFVVTAASYDDRLIGGRVAAGIAGVAVLLYLYATVRTRPLERTVGYGLLAAGILAPVIYPSYLLLGVICLAPSATQARRDWVIALSCAACVLAPVGLGGRGGDYATEIAFAIIALGLWLSDRRRPRPSVPANAAGVAG